MLSATKRPLATEMKYNKGQKIRVVLWLLKI